MATVSKPNTFSAGATIIASEHNDNFDTLYNLVNGNIDNANIKAAAAIANSKLNLASIAQNVAFTGTLDFSAATITAQTTFADLVATTADINGGTLDGVSVGTADASIGTFTTLEASTSINLTNTVTEFSTDGTLGGNSDSALPTEKAVKTYADTKKGSVELVSKTTWSTTNNSGNISISPNVKYKVIFSIAAANSADAAVTLIFNDDTGSNYANNGEAMGGSSNISFFTQEGNGTASKEGFSVGEFIIDTVNTDQMALNGSATYMTTTSNQLGRADLNGWWDNSDTLTHFDINTSANTTGEVLLYKFNEA